MLESKFQARLIVKLKGLFPGCVILKNDSSYRPGIPDLLILHHDRWAMLEAKRGPDEPPRPNQPYYVKTLNEMSFAAFIDPSNEQDVLRALQLALGPRGDPRPIRCE